MGLLKWAGFSKQPNLFEKIRVKTEQKESYTPNWLEWASKNCEQATASGTQAGLGWTTIYTIPKDKIFFLTNIAITGSGGGTSEVATIIGGNIYLHLIRLNCLSNVTSANAINFNMPIKISDNVDIELGVAGTGTFSVNIAGFLIPISAEKV